MRFTWRKSWLSDSTNRAGRWRLRGIRRPARQVLIEQWPGGPDDQRLGIAIFPATAPDKLVDEGLGDGIVHTYRISCVYDGPEGDFRTPGVCLTDAVLPGALRSPILESLSSQEPLQDVP